MATANPGVWGIDLGQCGLKAIRLELTDGKVSATAFDYIEHPKILSQPDADPDQLTREALEQFLSRNKVHGDMVAISVPGQSGLARFVKLPPVEEKKIADIVKFEAKQQIPFPLEEVVWDFQKIGSGVVTDGFAMETEIGLFAMKRDMVNRYLQHFKDVNVEIHFVQMSPLALCNFVSYDLLGKQVTPVDGAEQAPAGAEKKCVVALDIGTDNSNLVITDGEKIIWQRPIPLGGNHFTRALTKDLKLTFAKAEHLKRNAVKSPDLKKILAALKTVLNDFVGEVQRSLGYFTNTHRDAQIQYMVGLGNAFRLPGLQKFLQEKLQLEVRKLQSLERLSGEEVTAAPQFTENILSFGVAYGLALQALKLPRLQTNLLPYEIHFERTIRAKKPWAAAAAAALLLAVGGLTFARNIEFSAVDLNNNELKNAMKAAKDQKGIADKFDSDYSEVERQLRESQQAILRIQSGAAERFNWNLLCDYVGMALPQPDGRKLSPLTSQLVKAEERYFSGNKKAQEALGYANEKRFPKQNDKKPDPKKAADTDEYIKRHLVQINVEGIDGLYFDDLTPYFKAVKEGADAGKFKLDSMHPDERNKIEQAQSLPKKGWVFEVRGYTHHEAGNDFIRDTLLENLLRPENVKNVLSPEMKAKVKDRIGYFWVYGKKVTNPEAENFKLIKTSLIVQLMADKQAGAAGKGGPAPMMNAGGADGKPTPPGAGGGGGNKGADKRADWRPIGEVAGSLFGGPTAGGAFAGAAFAAARAGQQDGNTNIAVASERQFRTEFVLMFVWQEPTLEEAVDRAGAQPEAQP
jgi:type IV pilus assembly protein PilM